jgi:hypothetical protein
MADGAHDLQLTLNFPNPKARDDFEVAVRGFIKQYQQQAAVQYIVQQSQGSQLASGLTGGQPSTGGLQDQATVSHGTASTPQNALFGIGATTVNIPGIGGGSTEGFYLNFIGGW